MQRAAEIARMERLDATGQNPKASFTKEKLRLEAKLLQKSADDGDLHLPLSSKLKSLRAKKEQALQQFLDD